MEFLGIGPSELFFIILIAIIILGPKDMQKAGKTVGRWLNQFIRSDGYKALQRASREIRNLPTTLMREANIDEIQSLGRDIQKDLRQSIDPRTLTSPVSPSRNASSSLSAGAPPSNPVETPPQPNPSNDETTQQTSTPDEPEQP
jgi:sec-independent protein translocase protein TatB